MAKHKKFERSENYTFYSDLLWCSVPLTGMACYYYGMRPALLMLAGLLTAYLFDCALAPLHGAGHQPHEPSSECFAALIVLMMPATVSYSVVVAAVIAAVMVKEAFGGEGHYPFHPAAVGMAVAGISWPEQLYVYPVPGTKLPLFNPALKYATVEGMNTTLRGGGLPSDSTMELLTGNVSGGMGICASLVIVACGLFLLARGHLRPAVLIPFFVVCVGLPWLFPQLNELPFLSAPWQFVRQRVYLEKYILLSGTTLFGGLFLACEPVTMPNRTNAQVAYGIILGVAVFFFRNLSPYETPMCFALLIVDAIPEWLDLISHRTERIRFMKKEEQRLAQSSDTE